MSVENVPIYSPTPYSVDATTLNNSALEEYTRTILALPENLKKILTSFDTADFIEEKISLPFSLNVGQKRDVARVIRDAVLATTPLENMASDLGQRLQIDQSTAVSIANQILSQLFAPVIEELKQVQREKFGDRTYSSNVPTGQLGNQQTTNSISQQAHMQPPQNAILKTDGNLLDLRNQ